MLVMHGGTIVESGNSEDVFFRPRHAYTQQLMAALPGRKSLLET
jgi:ABC-type dipeptide/oligopeptide/nickel transport system ATPase component